MQKVQRHAKGSDLAKAPSCGLELVPDQIAARTAACIAVEAR